MPAQQIIPSASPNLSIPGLIFTYSLAPLGNRSLLLQEVIAYHTWLPGAEGKLRPSVRKMHFRCLMSWRQHLGASWEGVDCYSSKHPFPETFSMGKG